MPDEVQAKLINNNQKCIVDAHNKEFNPHRKTIADPAAGQKRPRDDNDASVQEQMEVGKIPQPDGKNTYSQLSSEFSELQDCDNGYFQIVHCPPGLRFRLSVVLLLLGSAAENILVLCCTFRTMHNAGSNLFQEIKCLAIQ